MKDNWLFGLKLFQFVPTEMLNLFNLVSTDENCTDTKVESKLGRTKTVYRREVEPFLKND